MKSSSLYFAAFALILPACLIARYGQAFSYFVATLNNLKMLKEKKALPDRVVSKPVTNPWPEPKSSEVLFGNSTRILWGYWDGGEENLPGLCQLALRSWRTRHPDWHIIIVSDESLNQYVSMSDLPSTYESLIVQHRSDIVRLALLLRYGGAYMDISTIVLKGLDGIWNSTSPETLLLTTPVPFQNGMFMVNNALILAPSPENPILREWQRRMLAYSEEPVAAVEEMRAHSDFQNVAPLFDDPALGILRDVVPYCCNLWILMDILYFNKSLASYIQKYVLSLPTRRWTFEIFSLPVLGKKSTYDPIDDPPIKSWDKRNLIRSMWQRTLLHFFDDPDRAERLMEQVNVLKLSSAGIDYRRPMSEHLERDSTVGRIYRAAVEEGPTAQATLRGARPIAVID